VVGRVEHAQFDPGGEPLVFWASRFGRYSEDRRTDAPKHVEGSYVAPSNVDLIQPIYEEWSRGNWRPSFDVYDPQMEWGWSDEFPGLAGVYDDRRDPNPRLRNWLSGWEHWRVDADEYLELGDHVVVLATYHGRGKGSGVEIEQKGGHVFELRDGKVVRLEIFASRDKAIESVRGRRARHGQRQPSRPGALRLSPGSSSSSSG
jgi:ketosteroid isomerase-like protein